MNPNSADLVVGIAIVALTVASIWLNARLARANARVARRDEILKEKQARLYAALDERDAAIAHAQDAQDVVDEVLGSRSRHPVSLRLVGGAS
jgi:hypothetical protein